MPRLHGKEYCDLASSTRGVERGTLHQILPPPPFDASQGTVSSPQLDEERRDEDRQRPRETGEEQQTSLPNFAAAMYSRALFP